MIPIHELLHRIQWDPEFGRGEFVLGYFDRVEKRIVTVPLRDIRLDPADHFGLQALDAEGVSHHIPFHRVRTVWRNGEPIWQRPG
jgi:uncharacterized protein (UPF0248 family)